jgi:hypothetical protein
MTLILLRFLDVGDCFIGNRQLESSGLSRGAFPRSESADGWFRSSVA